MTDPVDKIIARYRAHGIEAISANDSAEIKGFIRENGIDHPTSKTLAECFPVEADEVHDEHDPECTGCEHDCPWKGNPMGAPFCSICDDHMEAQDEE